MEQNTGSGKPTVFQVTGTLIHGITLIVVPLLALGSDQVLRGNIAMKKPLWEPCCVNLDIIDEVDIMEVAAELYKMNEKLRPIFLYAFPQTLDKWKVHLHRLIYKMLLQFVVLGEYHFISDYGHGFCPEYNRLLYDNVVG